MSQKREYIQQRKRTLLQNQQPSHLTAPTAPTDYVASQPSAVPAVASAVVTSAAFSAVASASHAVSYTSSVFGSSATVQAPASIAQSQYDYMGAGHHSTYSVAPPVASGTVPPIIPGYPTSQAPGFGSVPSNFPTRFPPPNMPPGYGTGYGYHGMMMPPPDQSFGSTIATTSADTAVSAWNTASTGGLSSYGQPSSYVQSGGQTSIVSSAQVPGTTPASNTSNFGHVSTESSGVRPLFPTGGGGPRGFGNQGDQRWPGTIGQQKSGFETQLGPRMNSNTSLVRPPGPNYSQEMDSFDDSGNFAEEDQWNKTGFEQNVPKSSSAPRPGGPGGFGPGLFGPRSDVGGGLRGPRPDAIGIGGPRGPRPNTSGAGPQPLMMQMLGPRAMGIRPRWHEEAGTYDEGDAAIEPESVNDEYGEEGQAGNAGMNFGQQGPRFPTPGFNQAPGRGIRPGMTDVRGGPVPRGVRPLQGERPGGPMPRGIRPGLGEASGGPRSFRPGFSEGTGGPMMRPGWGGQGPRMRFAGPAPGEEHIIDEQDEYNGENVHNSEQNEEHYEEAHFGEGNDYSQEESAREGGFPGRFGAPGQSGLRPSGLGFPQQRPFGMQRPRMDMRPQGAGFGPRGFPGPGVGARLRGPIPLMDIRVRPHSLSDVSPTEGGKNQGDEDYGENEEFPNEEMVESGEFHEEMPSGQPGIRLLGQLGIRPRMAGPRGFMGEQRQMEPGSVFQPRGQRMPDNRGSQMQRFPRGPGGPGPRGLPPGHDIGQRPQRPGLGDISAGQRGPRPLFGDSAMGQRPIRPGFGDQQGRFPRGPFPHGPRMMGPPRFGGSFANEYYGEEGFGEDEISGIMANAEFDNQGEVWDQSETRGDVRMLQQEKSEFPGRTVGQGVPARRYFCNYFLNAIVHKLIF